MGERSPVALAPFDSELHLVAWILQAVRDLAARDPKACVALICRSDEAARRLASYVRRGAVVRLAVGGEFLFRAGVSATCVREVKGLEFDHVIVADATQDAWPDTRESRRALYVAATRAMRQLVMASVGEPTPLVADSPE
jgi:DNA helicase IV